ncbi:MAG TPA: MGMT family protein [Puia sp.]|nr:MGMT family protein [Puia sp.]
MAKAKKKNNSAAKRLKRSGNAAGPLTTPKAAAATKPPPKSKTAAATKPPPNPVSASKPPLNTGGRASATPREKLRSVKPSGGQDDSFFDLVHEIARQIPSGRVTSYGAIAASLGTRLSARMVGWAMMAVPYAKKPVPAHRVVNRVGLLTGKHHYDPPGKMQELLEKEGVVVKDDKVVDFSKLFWDPAKEL